MIECCTSGANRAGFIHTRCFLAFVVTFCLECSEIGTSGMRTTAFLNTILRDFVFDCFGFFSRGLKWDSGDLF